MAKKIFCVGSHKTATTSMAKALETLSYKVCRRIKMLEEQMTESSVLKCLESSQYQTIFDAVENFDAFVDNPWPLVYQEADRQFPGSKFILTLRNEEEWLQSVTNYFQGYESNIRKFIYGKASPLGNEQLYLERYRKHNLEVLDYFKNRPNDLLVIEVEKNLNWETLCNFLEKDVPSTDFPAENRNTLKDLGKLEVPYKRKLNANRLSGFTKLDNKQKLLFLEAFAYLTLSRSLILFLPFKKIAKQMGKTMNESSEELEKSKLEKVKSVGKAIKKASLYTPFRSLCFEQALALKFMLNKRSIDSTIYFGIAKEKNKLNAHAWTRSGKYFVTGNKGKECFQVVSTFS